MTILIIGVILWWATHLFPLMAVERRDMLAVRLGESAYKGVFAIASVAAIAVMVIGYQQADFVALWTPPTFLWHLNNLLMLFAVALFIAGGIPSIVRRKVRNPQLAGVKVWALAHLLVNGDLASVVLFGGVLGWAVLAMISTKRRDGPRTAYPEQTKAGLPIHILATLAVYWVIVYIHGGLLGVSPLPG